MSEYIIKRLSKQIDLASYESSLLAFKKLSAYCKHFGKDFDDYQVVERTYLNGVTKDEIVSVLR